MKILIDINHPAHVHLFKEFARIMIHKGHNILFTAREKDVAVTLLKEYELNYVSLGRHYKNMSGKLLGLIKYDYLMFKLARKFEPDVFLSMASIYAAHVAFLSRRPHIAFEDSEPVPEHQILYVPFTPTILTPLNLNKDFGSKQIRYHGFHEVAYLHPNYFKPDLSIFSYLGIKPEQRYALLRFVSFNASHDIGIKGFSDEDKVYIVRELEKYGNVFITSEGNYPKELNKNIVQIPPSKIHDALAYASLYMGDSQTMATEAALLGTPAIRCNAFAASSKEMSNFIELENEYKLLLNVNIANKEKAINKAIEYFKNSELKKAWQEKRKTIFSKKIDVTAFMVWFVENYPESVDIMKRNGEHRFIYK